MSIKHEGEKKVLSVELSNQLLLGQAGPARFIYITYVN